MRPLFLACAIALCTTPPLHAETYKWVDENGVTNYSSEPPPSSKKATAKVVEDKISVVPTDPNFEKSAEALRKREEKRQQQAEADYARRQAATPAPKQATYDIYDECPYGMDCSGYGYYPGDGYYGNNRPVRRRPPYVVHHDVPVNSNNFGAAPGYTPARTIPSPIQGAPRAPAPTPLR